MAEPKVKIALFIADAAKGERRGDVREWRAGGIRALPEDYQESRDGLYFCGNCGDPVKFKPASQTKRKVRAHWSHYLLPPAECEWHSQHTAVGPDRPRFRARPPEPIRLVLALGKEEAGEGEDQGPDVSVAELERVLRPGSITDATRPPGGKAGRITSLEQFAKRLLTDYLSGVLDLERANEGAARLLVNMLRHLDEVPTRGDLPAVLTEYWVWWGDVSKLNSAKKPGDIYDFLNFKSEKEDGPHVRLTRGLLGTDPAHLPQPGEMWMAYGRMEKRGQCFVLVRKRNRIAKIPPELRREMEELKRD